MLNHIKIDELINKNQQDIIISILDGVTYPEQRTKIIDKAIRLIKHDVISEVKDSNNRYLPRYKQYEIVHCNFTGIGFEWDFPHYAVVWNVDPILDSIEVIPMTSITRDEYSDVINIGKIHGLPNKASTLLVSDRTRVSRKRLQPVMFNHPKHGKKSVVIPKSWNKAIRGGIMSKNMGCITFQKPLSEKCGIAMIDSLKLFDELKFKAMIEYTYNESSKLLTFREWDKQYFEKVDLVMPISIKITSKNIKRKKLKWLNSHQKHLKSLSTQYFNEIYGILT